MDGRTKLVRTQAVVARVVAGETLIVPVRGKVGDLASIYKFNASGTLIWKLLDKAQTLEAVASALAQQYEIEPEQAVHDVEAFVGEMEAVGLVEVATPFAMVGD